MSPYVQAGLFLCAVSVAALTVAWVDHCRRTRRAEARVANSEAASRTCEAAFVTRAGEDFSDAEARYDALIEEALQEGSRTPIGDASAAHIAAQAAVDLDAEWAKLAGGAA